MIEPVVASPSLPSTTSPLVIVSGGRSALTIIPSDPEETFKNVVLSADLIVSGNITGLRYEVVTVFPAKPDRDTSGNATEEMWAYTDNNTTPGKFAYTIFTLKVDKVIKGDPTTKEVFIKAPGGYIGEIYQVPIEWYFKIADQVLLSLQQGSDNTYTVLSYGMLWIQGSAMSTAPLKDITVRIIQIMKANNVPITLPESEWPDLPTGPVQLPEMRPE